MQSNASSSRHGEEVNFQGVVMDSNEQQFFKNLGRRIAEQRNKRGLTQVQLAAILGVAQQTYASYETGTRRIDLSSLSTLAKALATDEITLLGWSAKARRHVRRSS